MNKEWRPVVGFEGIYEVSNHGDVRSMDRVREMRVVRWTNSPPRKTIISVPHRWKGKALQPRTTPDGYRGVHLVAGSTKRTPLVHVLVAEAFHGVKPDPTYQVAHLNGRRADNRAENLVWVQPLENTSHRVLHGTNHGHATKRALKRRAATILIKAGLSSSEVAFCLKLTEPSVVRLSS